MPKHALQKDPRVQLCVDKINEYLKKNDIKQKAVVNKTHITQPQLSKILGGKLKKESDDFIKLCDYAGIKFPPELADPLMDDRIKVAIRKVWDGRDETIVLIVRLLECAAHVNNSQRS